MIILLEIFFSFLFKELQRERGRQLFHLLVHSLAGHDGSTWPCQGQTPVAPPKPPDWLAGAQITRPSTMTFPSPLEGSVLEMEQLGHELLPAWVADIAGSGFTHYTTVLISVHHHHHYYCVSSFLQCFLWAIISYIALLYKHKSYVSIHGKATLKIVYWDYEACLYYMKTL